MTCVTYPGTYVDRNGLEALVFHNDGTTLTTTIRGIRFEGRSFDSLAPTSPAQGAQLASFTLNDGDLCGCTLALDIPMPVIVGRATTTGVLHVQLQLGQPAPNGGVDHEHLTLTLTYQDGTCASPGTSGLFECELLALQGQLPDDVHLQACITCLYSDYSPYGQGLFGTMLCFRNMKAEYLRVSSKDDFWAVHGREDRQVQETFLCDQFKRRIAGTGYRG